MPSSKIKLLGILVIAVLIALGLWFSLQKLKTTVRNPVGKSDKEKKEHKNLVAVTQKDVDASRLPDGMPQDIPLEVGAKVLQNYNATTPDGRFQANRMFQTKLGLQENREIYVNYFKSKGWKISAEVSRPTNVVISAVKGAGEFITVTVDENAIAKIRTVDIVYFVAPSAEKATENKTKK